MIVNELICRFIDILRASKRTLSGILMSAPGNMKTGTVSLYAKARNLRLATVIPSQYSFDEILGFQKIDEKDPNRTKRTKPDWYDEMMEYPDDEWILFVDEISTANPYLQGGLLGLIMNKKIGKDMYLPKNTTIIAAGNYMDNLDNEITMNAALINRFLILNLNKIEFSKDDLKVIINSENYYDKFMSDDYNDLESIKDFIGLNKIERYEDSIVDKLINQCISSVDLNRTDQIKNSTEDGLIGFTSPRTLVYAKKFFKLANSLGLLDKSCLKIVSDTMGVTKLNDTYIYNRLLQIYETYAKTLETEYGLNIPEEITKCGDDSDKWINLIERIIKNKLYNDVTFNQSYFTKLRDEALKKFTSGTKVFDKLAELVRLRTNSLENEI